MNKNLRKRWNTESGRLFVENLSRLGRSGNGYEVRESPWGGAEEKGRLDLRGLILPERTELRRIYFQSADLTGAVLRNTRFELSAFTDVWFNAASLRGLAETGSVFESCAFRTTDFRRAIIGYGGSRFDKCLFEHADFIGGGFIRPEFDDCCFDGCTFSGVDFNGGSFLRCEFRGEVRGVWFRGSFPLASDAERYGTPRPNRMGQVSFRNAKLIDVTFSDHCDLCSVTVPGDGRHELFDHWPERITSLLGESRSWEEPAREAAERFFKSCELHAAKQRCYLMGVDELVNLYGADAGVKIWEALRHRL